MKTVTIKGKPIEFFGFRRKRYNDFLCEMDYTEEHYCVSPDKLVFGIVDPEYQCNDIRCVVLCTSKERAKEFLQLLRDSFGTSDPHGGLIESDITKKDLDNLIVQRLVMA